MRSTFVPTFAYENGSFVSDKSALSITSVLPNVLNLRHEFTGRSNVGFGAVTGKTHSVLSSLVKTPDGAKITTDDFVARVSLKNGDLSVAYTTKDNLTFCSDLMHRAYESTSHGVHHYLSYNDQCHYYGLGERASPLDLNGRHFRLETMDALGYNPTLTDPLYKHFPFYICLNPSTQLAYGIYYDCLGSGTIDLGCEIDAFWGPFVAYRQSWGSLNAYIIYGPTVRQVVARFAQLVGLAPPVPKYALGYLASSMGYAESSNAQELLEAFPSTCQKYDIPCDLMHLSSGYTVDPVSGARNVFTWNKERFPDPKKMFTVLKGAGIRVVANIKPWLLSAHPDYALLSQNGGFVWDKANDKPSLTRLWSAGAGDTSTGSYFDFTSPFALDYWKSNVKSLLNLGVAGIWNDNNEYALHDDLHTFAGGSTPLGVGEGGRSFQTSLMAKASFDAMREHNVSQRPFLITRSSAPGAHVYASQTWSGDNYSSWKTLKHNIPMGLNAGLSLMSGYGHDVGGFVGPRPSPELFVRWIQNGIFHPRFCIHSWKDEGVTEPWMYPEMLPIIRDAIHFRYELIPYLYWLSLEASLTGAPVIRPLVYEFQEDPQTHTCSFEFMLGPSLLIGSVVEQGGLERSLYLPASSQWCNFFTGKWTHGGQTVTVPVPLSQPGAIFVEQDCIIPTGKLMKHVGASVDDFRNFLIFPVTFSATVYIDDDGISFQAPLFKVSIGVAVVDALVAIELTVMQRDFVPAYKSIRFTLPFGDARGFIRGPYSIDDQGRRFIDLTF